MIGLVGSQLLPALMILIVCLSLYVKSPATADVSEKKRLPTANGVGWGGGVCGGKADELMTGLVGVKYMKYLSSS